MFGTKSTAALAAILISGAPLFGQPPAKTVKDQGEYTLLTDSGKETDWNRKLALLEEWKRKYPDSSYREERQQMLAVTYQNLRQGEKMWEASRELLALNRASFPALLFLASLTMGLGQAAPDRLDTGETAAQGVLSALPAVFDPARKPANLPPDDFLREKRAYERMAMKTLAWIEVNRKNPVKAEERIVRYLKEFPNDGTASYWLAQAILQQKPTDKQRQLHALYHWARASHYKGENELPPAARTSVETAFRKNYANYHGSEDGIAEAVKTALASPFPPEGWSILSSAEIAAGRRRDLEQSNPMLASWLNLKDGLTNNETSSGNWEQLQGAALPRFKGRVISSEPAARPKVLLVAIAGQEPEMKLRLDSAFPNAAGPGAEIEFEGAVAAELTANPFLITADIERKGIAGWPAAARPAASRKAPGRTFAPKLP